MSFIPELAKIISDYASDKYVIDPKFANMFDFDIDYIETWHQSLFLNRHPWIVGKIRYYVSEMINSPRRYFQFLLENERYRILRNYTEDREDDIYLAIKEDEKNTVNIGEDEEKEDAWVRVYRTHPNKETLNTTIIDIVMSNVKNILKLKRKYLDYMGLYNEEKPFLTEEEIYKFAKMRIKYEPKEELFFSQQNVLEFEYPYIKGDDFVYFLEKNREYYRNELLFNPNKLVDFLFIKEVRLYFEKIIAGDDEYNEDFSRHSSHLKHYFSNCDMDTERFETMLSLDPENIYILSNPKIFVLDKDMNEQIRNKLLN